MTRLLRILPPCLPGVIGGAWLLVALGCASTGNHSASGEDRLIAQLASSDPETVVDALRDLPGRYPQSTNAVAAIRPFLQDPRYRRHAARALGDYHAELPLDDVRLILGLLGSHDSNDVTDGLKALRGLREPTPVVDLMVQQMIPLLKDPNNHIVRDTCRTLAVHGNPEVIPYIEPLLQRPRWDVKKDAQDAIDALRPHPVER